MADKKPKWAWGKSPSPKNWHEAAEALRSVQPKPKRESLRDLVERLAKEKKNA
jgi:hypothetical protein